jgi:hypothetical protein
MGKGRWGMTTFVALYRGDTVADARLVAVSADPSLVSQIAAQLLEREAARGDPVLAPLERGRRATLRAIGREVGFGQRQQGAHDADG